jgi:hypothetical protein
MILMTLTFGCAGLNTAQTGAVHYINISESVSPKVLRAKAGDEVRWVNLSRQAVRLHITGNMDAVVSQRGFGNVGGTTIRSTWIASEDFASLCLGKGGEVKFFVQREEDEPRPTEKRVLTEPSGLDRHREWMARIKHDKG